MRYRNVAAAADWLCTAFGFEKHRIVTADGGEVAVAQLSVGPNMIMLLPVGGSELDRLMKQPDEIGGAETQSCYVVVDDIDVHHAKAKKAGAQFVLDLKEYDSGGRGFSCRDPEGHIWSFGTYDPADGQSVGAGAAAARDPGRRGARIGAAMIAAMLAIAVLFGGGGWVLATLRQDTPQQGTSSAEIVRLRQEAAAAQQRAQQALERAARDTAGLSRERSEREAAERAAKQAAEQLANGRSAKEAAERAAKQLEAQLAEERRAKEAAERTAKQAADQLANGAKEAAERAAKQVEAQLTEERRAKEAAERAAKAANDQIARERTAKQAAQNATSVVQKELALARAARQAAEQAAKEAAEQLALERAAREAAERAVKGSPGKSGQSQNEKSIPLPPANSDQAPKKMSRKSGQAGAAEPMPALLP